MRLVRISLTLSLHVSLSFIDSGRSSGLHPVSSHSCCKSKYQYALNHNKLNLFIISLHHNWEESLERVLCNIEQIAPIYIPFYSFILKSLFHSHFQIQPSRLELYDTLVLSMQRIKTSPKKCQWYVTKRFDDEIASRVLGNVKRSLIVIKPWYTPNKSEPKINGKIDR